MSMKDEYIVEPEIIMSRCLADYAKKLQEDD